MPTSNMFDSSKTVRMPKIEKKEFRRSCITDVFWKLSHDIHKSKVEISQNNKISKVWIWVLFSFHFFGIFFCEALSTSIRFFFLDDGELARSVWANFVYSVCSGSAQKTRQIHKDLVYIQDTRWWWWYWLRICNLLPFQLQTCLFFIHFL